MENIETAIIDFLMRYGIWENHYYYSYKTNPAFMKGIQIIVGKGDNETTFVPSYMEFDKLHNHLSIVYVNTDDKRDFLHKSFDSHIEDEQEKFAEMVHYVIQTINLVV